MISEFERLQASYILYMSQGEALVIVLILRIRGPSVGNSPLIRENTPISREFFTYVGQDSTVSPDFGGQHLLFFGALGA